ncbi:MAG TPA: hypothetical protein VEJ45_03710 [Candidatus Acidoferrales bacterium]|nr:hypothetical protein [Candidatus Acidoferrales bacterium]
MRALNLLIAVLTFSVTAPTGTAHNQAMGKMQGGCGDYTADLHSEMKLMSAQLTDVTSGSGAADAAQIRPGVAYSVRLLPQQQVHFALPPGQNRGGAGRSAGVLSLSDLPAGSWRISTDNPVWLDLVASGQIVDSSAFEMKMACTTILKTVLYTVRGKGPVLIQVNGATQRTVRLLVTAVAAPAR